MNLFGNISKRRQPIGAELEERRENFNVPREDSKPSLFANSTQQEVQTQAPQAHQAFVEDSDMAYNPRLFPEKSATDSMATNSDYNYGLEKPERYKPKWYDYVAAIGLPAIASGLSGRGALRGGVDGLIGALGARKTIADQSINDFNTERSFRQKDKQIAVDDTLARQKAADDSLFRKATLGISKRNADSNRMRAERGPQGPQPTEIEKIAKAQSRIDQAKAIGSIPDDEDLALVELYKQKNFIQ